MPDTLQNRLNRHEEQPPASVWNTISTRLEEEFSASDSILADRIEMASVTPPPSALNYILSELGETKEEAAKTGTKVIPIFYKRLAVAVLIAAVMAVSAMYLFTGSNVKSTFIKRPQVTATEKPVQTHDSNSPSSRPMLQRRDSNREEKTLIASSQRISAVSAFESGKSDAEQDYVSYGLTEAHSTPLEPVNALQPISVSAPLIRDSHGNIIMDLRLITKPGQPYVTITGPNGNQTRISNKFLNCLSYINGTNTGDTDAEANDCKEKFAEWRNKLLSEAAFIPAANNFFDIFELKEMIQD